MAESEKISSYSKNEIIKVDEEQTFSYHKSLFHSLDSTKKFLKDLSFPDNFIEEYSLLFHNKKIYLKSKDYSKFFIMSHFTNGKEKIIKLDDSVKFISMDEFLEMLSHSKFFEQFPIILLKSSVLIAAIEEESPIKISDIQNIKNNVISLNNDPNIIFDEWQRNSGILSEEDNNILRILEYRNDIYLKKVDLQITNMIGSCCNVIINHDNKATEKKKENLKEQSGNTDIFDNRVSNPDNVYNNISDSKNYNNFSNYNYTNFSNMALSGLDDYYNTILIEKYNQNIQNERSSNIERKSSNNPDISRKLEIQTKHRKYQNYITDHNYNSQSQTKNNFQEKLKKEKSHQYKHFIAGALSGLISRIITAPLERLKILYQVNYAGKGLKPPNILSGLQQVYLADGFLGLFRGNLVNLIKCTPDSAIKLYIFEKAKFYFSKKEKENKLKLITRNPTLTLLICGGASGICATICLFPLDVIKTRIAASSNLRYNGILDTAIKLYYEGGLRIFYRGIQASLSSAVPNCGLNLTAYETLKRLFSGSTSVDNAKLLTTPTLMLIGGLSAMFSSTILYPMQTIQSRIIMGTIFLKKPYQNMYITDLINKDAKKIGLIKLAKHTIKAEGFKGFYKGYCPGISKIILGNALGFSLYENIKNVMDLI